MLRVDAIPGKEAHRMNVYECSYVNDEGNMSVWPASWELVGAGKDYEELKIRGRGTCYHIVIGCYSNGNYLCIPEIDIGCALSSLNDAFWNYDRLSRILGSTDAVTISQGLRDYLISG